MVYLVLTRDGLDEVRSRFQPSDVVWAGRRVLSSEEAESLGDQGLTIFHHDIDPADSVAAAGWTYKMAEMHPGQPIWVEPIDGVVQEGRRKQQLAPQRWIYPILLALLVLFLGILANYLSPYFGQVVAWISRMP